MSSHLSEGHREDCSAAARPREGQRPDGSAPAPLERYVRLLLQALGVPGALIGRVDARRQAVTEYVALPEAVAALHEAPIVHALLQHVVATRQPLLVAHVRGHPLAAQTPAGASSDSVAFAGVPLVASDGAVVGALVALDREPHAWSAAERVTLSEVAAAVETELQLRADLDAATVRAAQLDEAHAALEAHVARRTAQLEATNAGLRALMASATDGIVIVNRGGTVIGWNESAQRIFGYARDAIVGQPLTTVIPFTLQELQQRGMARFQGGDPQASGSTVELEGRRRDGSHFPLELSLTQWTADGEVFFSGFLRDITARRLIETELRASEQDYRRLFEQAHDAILIFDPDDEVVLDANERAGEIYGFARDELIGMSLTAISADPVGGRAFVQQTLELGTRAKFESVQRRKDGSTMFLEINAAVIEYRGRRSILSVNRDITERVTAEATIHRMANYDDLTSLPNRLLFHDRVQQALATRERSNAGLAVMCIGLSRFTLINDTLGHGGGDQVLRIVAQRLSGSLRGGDTLARLAGDEFAVLLPNIAGPQPVADMVQRLIETVARPLTVEGRELTIRANIGISICPTDGRSADVLITRATTAMARAKRSRDHRFQFFTLAMNQDAQRQLALEEELRRALRDDEFEVWYQPQVVLATGGLIGFEALVRWRHPTHGLITPANFIPLAEETGLIVPLGALVLRAACCQAAIWRAAGHPARRIAVNISARQFHQVDLAKLVRATLAETGLPPGALELEITESMLMADVERTRALLGELREIGVQLAMDDFGTGYSSLAQLKEFPLDTLKIDRSFIRNIADSTRDAAIVKAIISLAQTLGLAVVGEGVESEAQAAFLTAHGCEIGQGYLWGAAQPAAALDADPAMLPAPRLLLPAG